jgi:hypothetical protein
LAGDVASAVVFVKIRERRASMTGMNAPQSDAVQLIHANPPEKRTSTEIARDMLDSVPGITVRERFLIDKADEIGGPGITAEESAEIDELRKARGKGPRSEDLSS